MYQKNERSSEKALMFNQMAETIENCHKLLDIHHLKYGKIPNIAITYSNKLLLLKHEFSNAGIDFYGSTCESSSIINFQLQSFMLNATNYLSSCISVLNVSKEQVDEFVASYKKPSFYESFFKGATYNPKKSFLTSEQKQKVIYYLDNYVGCDDAIYNFDLNDMDASIKFYKTFAMRLGVSERVFNLRVEKIHNELNLLGYDN